jgi:hypothetical protein
MHSWRCHKMADLPMAFVIVKGSGQSHHLFPRQSLFLSHPSGFRLNATVLKATVVSQWINCIMECATELCCRSINFKKTFKNESNCEMLHDVVYNTSEKFLQANSSYDYAYLANPAKVFWII